MGGLRGLTSVWAQNLPDSVKRRFYKNWHLAKQNNGGKAFTKYAKRWTLEAKDKKHVNRDIERIKKYCAVVRVFAATQIDKMRNFRQKKSHLMEIQLNGGDAAAKVKWAQDHLEKDIRVSSIFEENEMIDTISITRGKGTCGVIKRFNVNRLPRKTHRGLKRSLVSVHGIHLPLSGLLLELVTSVITTEPRSTRRSTELELVLIPVNNNA